MEISALKKIIDITETYKGDYIGPLERFFIDRKFPKLTLFFKIIKEGKAKNDDDAAFLLSFSTPFSKEYEKTKLEMEERVMHLLFFIDSRKVPRSHMWKSYIPGFRKSVAAELIFYMGIDAAPLELAKAGYEQIESIKFSEKKILPVVNLVRFTSNAHDHAGFKKYAPIALKTISQSLEEVRAAIYKMELGFIISKSEGEKFKHRQKAKKYLTELKKIFEKVNSLDTFDSYIYTGINVGNFYKDYPLVVETTRKADEWYKKNNQLNSKQAMAGIALHRLYAKVFMRDFKNTHEDLKLGLEVFDENFKDWTSFLEVFFLLNMFTANYEKALDIYYRVFKSPVYPDLPQDIKERWKYFEPYLNFVIADDFVKENLDLLSFLNEISYYTEHKSDNNIPILVGQVISMMEMGEFKKLAERTGYLESYIKKYVDKKNFMRSYIFLNMLLKLFKNKFDPFKTEKQVESKWKKLEFRNDNKYRYCDEIEVIPYDHLWLMIIERLKARLS